MEMSAVVKLAVLRMGLKVGHQLRQLHWLNVMQAKFLKSGRINQSCGARRINPVQRGAGRGVFA